MIDLSISSILSMLTSENSDDFVRALCITSIISKVCPSWTCKTKEEDGEVKLIIGLGKKSNSVETAEGGRG